MSGHPRTGDYPVIRVNRMQRPGEPLGTLGDDLLSVLSTTHSPIAVLLLESEVMCAERIQAALALGHGTTSFAVTWRAGLEEGVAALATGSPDVILVDESMTDAEGMAALAMLHDAAPSLPIVVLTERDDDSAASAALRAGAQDYLCKPYITSALLERSIRYAIERKRAELAIRRAQWLAGIGETALALQHEINNPLAVLIAHAEFIERGGTPEDNAESMREMVLAAERIAGIVQHLGQLGEPRSVVATHGKRMLDLSRPRRANSA